MDTRTKKIGTLAAVTALATSGASLAQGPVAPIRICQTGYAVDGPKVAVLVGSTPTGPVQLKRVSDGKVVEMPALGPLTHDTDSGDDVRSIAFAWRTPGEYVIDVPGVGASRPFRIDRKPYARPFRLAMRAFTGQRASIAVSLAPDFPQFHHAAGHTAPAQYDPSSGKTGTRDVTGGWYDAGDYGRYVVNSGISTGTLLWAYELYGPKLRKLNLDIPESGGPIPDVLAEAKWNLDWMLKMQDDDGGAWHKATTAQFSGFVAPEKDAAPVLVIGTGHAPYKNTTATADLAAVAAIAARVYRPFDRAYADRCLAAATRAWTWAEAHPDVLYRQNPPGIGTGGYGDNDARDERLWASAELFRTTGEKPYADAFAALANGFHLRGDATQGWPSVGNLGLYTYALSGRKEADPALVARIRGEAVQAADAIAARTGSNGYGCPLTSTDYTWGSNSVVANYGMMLLLADRIAPKPAYRDAVARSVQYLLGLNALDTSYVTGLGNRSPLHPHHRISASDGVDAPWPGMLVGGPNAEGRTPPAKQWEDKEANYRVNEIAINWNAPLVFVLAGLL